MSVSDLSDTQSALLNAVLQFYTVTHITPDFWNTALSIITDDFSTSQKSDIAAILPHCKLQHPDEHFWSDYISGLVEDDDLRKIELYRSSSDCGNPYAMYEYAELLCDDDMATARKYYLKSCDVGYAGAIGRLVDIIVQWENIVFHVVEIDDATQQHAVMAELLSCVPYLQRFGDKYTDTIAEIYDAADKCEYPSPSHDMPWDYKSLLYRTRSNYCWTDSRSYIRTAENMIHSYEQLFRTHTADARTIAQLRALHKAPLNNLCTNIN